MRAWPSLKWLKKTSDDVAGAMLELRNTSITDARKSPNVQIEKTKS